MVLSKVRSGCISQEVQAGFEQIYCRENANIKVCPYQVMISNEARNKFEETNEHRIFSK